ncbi:2-succinyl-5-enolpyruvyl-6-hydroxy-3-cyclohexene-1-carboxylic-acid synthase [Micromonospora sp. KC721]|uniref:2-succinyl-5-enolpyruvyl-6-hydroxy-3- cyclohexene-1-carboxylic-acid synthase n=1 Tax=Micromonospora sp. KC721 TaxID=2530380 RepID=UPI00104B1349|nr:2-succinyl-5-enolpyruvyl-6-hydroxy-3-cyclohexene-1-carboxylic-acid synthase [Micromonospora sp. KC721]TDB82276.1 2-succinyl-5-enolpyruvyl-6-hydroxy-3-cyclohexene-1-carboxylic-acid synthase [Micromonospora sp. KC721]
MSVTTVPGGSAVDGLTLDPATALATVLADELSRCGVTDAVVSPGSRSAPLARALWAHPRIVVHVRVDERSAGYLAIGLARGSGRPAAVVCTSGTAAANLYPAVLEAHHDRVPLVVLSADRPPELRGTGANQTTDQTKLYGASVRLFIELGVPERRRGQVRYWRSVVSRAVDAARTGPVHVNVALREARLDGTPAAWPEPLDGRAGGEAWTVVSSPAPPVTDLAVPPRGLVVAGAGADAAGAVAFAEAAGWPLLAEPHSSARRGPHALTSYVDLLAHPAIRAELAPEAIVTYGRPGLSRELLGRYGDVPNTVVDPHPAWDDPTRDAALVVPALDRPLLTGPRDPAWLARWQALDRVACAALDGVLDVSGLTEPRVARDVAARVPDGGLLFVAASMPIRDLERTMRPRTGLTVLANRGLAGIDGAVSTAIGAALAHRERGGGRAYGLLGDLSFLHDQNGLLLGSGPVPDLTLVVVNNDGGGIFSLLEAAGTDDGFEELFGTPHGAELAHVAAAAGWRYARVDEPGHLAYQLARPGARIVEVRTAREPNAVLHRRLRRDVATALDAAL